MGRRRRWNKNKESGQTFQEANDPIARLLAVHPSRPVLAVAVGNHLRVVDTSSGKVLLSASGAEGGGHSAPIHALSFSADGRLLLTGSEDKLLKVWCADSWRCVRVLSAPKKISAAAFSANASHVMFADKFGDVQVGATGPAAPPPAEGSAPAAPAPVPGSLLLGHFCAVVTSLQATADGKYVISTDRESKVRVSAMPKEPTKGSYEIQSYCLGHTSFVTSSALAAPGSGLLLTSGGDGAVRLWAYESGKLLDTYQVATPAQAAPQADAAAAAAAGASGAAAGEAGEAGGESGSGEDEGEDDGDDAAAAGGDGGDAEPANGCSIRQRVDCAPVLSVAVHGCTVAAVVEGSQEVTLLDIQPPPAAASSSGAAPTYRLAFKQKLAMPQDIFLPCQVAFDPAGRLIVLGGPVVVTSHAAHFAIAAPDPASGAYALCTEKALPSATRAALEARDAEEEALLADSGLQGGAEGASAAGEGTAAYSRHLKKKAFTVEELQARKRARRDYIEAERLKTQREAADAKAAAQAAKAASGAAAVDEQ